MGVGNISLSDQTSSKSDSLASVGDNSYIVDSSTQLDFGGANIDTSTNVSVGLQGGEVSALAGMMQNAIGAVSEVASQSARVANNVATQESGVTTFLRENAAYIVAAAIAVIALLNLDKIRKAIK